MTEIADIHTHILPGIDDGAKDWDVCLNMLARSWENGVRRIFATPHMIPWEKSIDPGEIIKLCERVRTRAKKELGMDMEIYPGQELYYHLDITEKIKKGQALTLAGSRYVLMEFATDISYRVMYRGIKEISEAHYRPVIAHVERYRCLRKPGRIQELKDIGVLLQMNVEAFQGGFFDETSRWAKKCLINRQIDFLASDMHNLKERPPMSRKALEWAEKKLDAQYLKEILCTNCEKILIQ